MDANSNHGLDLSVEEQNDKKTKTSVSSHLPDAVEGDNLKIPAVKDIENCPPKLLQRPVERKKFIYGNYDRYYGYRNKDHNHEDIRLNIFNQYKELFENKDILDIGCNCGQITMSIADKFQPKSITGLDIEHKLINKAVKTVVKSKKSLPWKNERKTAGKFPYNIAFLCADYVLRDDILLEVEEVQKFDVILALSITKWIHLNYADAGLKQAFRRMYKQLQPSGVLILEAQSFDNYERRKNLSVSKSSSPLLYFYN